MVMFSSAVVVSSLIVVVWFGTAGGDWSYSGGDGPTNWGKQYEKCKGKKQSPIDIKAPKTKKDIGTFTFSGYDTLPAENTYVIHNNGHTVQMNVNGPTMVVNGGGLPGTAGFKLAQFHMHWGSDDRKGSEHTIEGASYPLEIHLVHYNLKYSGGVHEAVSKDDGLAVLGIFADIGHSAHRTIDQLLDVISGVRYAGYNQSVSQFKMETILPQNRDHFVRYSGSLTTPKCDESVTWTVFNEPIEISQTQINSLRAVSHSTRGSDHDEPLVNNFRPTMPLGSREVHKTFDAAVKKPKKKMYNAATMATLSLLLLLLPVGLLTFFTADVYRR